MSDQNQQIDLEKTQKFAQEIFGHLAGALVSGTIYLGERMGLFRALNGAGPLTSEENSRARPALMNAGFASGSISRPPRT